MTHTNLFLIATEALAKRLSHAIGKDIDLIVILISPRLTGELTDICVTSTIDESATAIKFLDIARNQLSMAKTITKL